MLDLFVAHSDGSYLHRGPRGRPSGTLSILTIRLWTRAAIQETVVLRAVPPIATEKQSWGTLKKHFQVKAALKALDPRCRESPLRTSAIDAGTEIVFNLDFSPDSTTISRRGSEKLFARNLTSLLLASPARRGGHLNTKLPGRIPAEELVSRGCRLNPDAEPDPPRAAIRDVLHPSRGWSGSF